MTKKTARFRLILWPPHTLRVRLSEQKAIFNVRRTLGMDAPVAILVLARVSTLSPFHGLVQRETDRRSLKKWTGVAIFSVKFTSQSIGKTHLRHAHSEVTSEVGLQTSTTYTAEHHYDRHPQGAPVMTRTNFLN